jgi:Raf kinase inhibitor-like YbhB/YbcL family protein
MRKLLYTAILGIATGYVPASFADSPAPIEVKAEGIAPDGTIDAGHAFCAPDAKVHVKEGGNRSIGLSWSAGPAGTKSYAVIAVDPDVPTVFDDAGKEGKTIPASMKRKDFYHWILFNVPKDTTSLPEGIDSQAVVKKGKSVIKTPYGKRGINDYAPYFATQPDRAGVYAGYDGPCPPWNDERVHHYHFNVYALDAELGILGKDTDGPTAMKAITPHILAKGEVVGTYTLNPNIKAY